MQNENFLVGIDFPLAYHHAGDDVGGRSDPADGDPFPFEIFRLGDIFSHDENVLEAVDDNADGFDFHYARDGEIEHGRQVGVGDVDVAAGNRLSHNAAAIEVNRFDVDPVFVPKFFLLDDAPQIGGNARSAVAHDNRI